MTESTENLTNEEEAPINSENAENNAEVNTVSEEEILDPQVQIDALNDKYLRLYAEFDNYRRRTTKERLELFKTASQDILTELIPVLERYENAGKIYFNAILEGPTTNGRQPFIDATFGASEAYLENSSVKKRIDKMGFAGHFTNGEDRDFQTMEFSMTDITATIEKGNFVGDILVKNFEAPEIEMSIDADFDIPFIVGFLNLSEIEDAKSV